MTTGLFPEGETPEATLREVTMPMAFHYPLYTSDLKLWLFSDDLVGLKGSRPIDLVFTLGYFIQCEKWEGHEGLMVSLKLVSI